VAPLAEVSGALNWKVFGKAFQELRKHPAVSGVLVETRRLELKETRKWGKRS
jgi:DNA polymerase-3 subunit alpha